MAWIRPLLFLLLPWFVCCGPGLPPCAAVPRASSEAVDSLLAARSAWRLLDHPRAATRAAAVVGYHAATADLFERLRCDPAGWDAAAARQGTVMAAAGGGRVHPAAFDAVVPAAALIAGEVNGRRRTGTLGVPVVGWRAKRDPPQRPFMPPAGETVALTAMLRFDAPGAPVWHFHEAGAAGDVRVGGRRYTPAVDPAAADALYWRLARLADSAPLNLLRPGRFAEQTGLFFPEPYDPRKIPVVLVHGLGSSPSAFRVLAAEVAADPVLRQRYQIWYFGYATGNPWFYSAALFRDRVREAADHARREGGGETIGKMVVIAHSMGGLLVRGSISEPGTKLFQTAFARPIDELVVPAEVERHLRGIYLYEPLDEPSRVIFMAVPHRGSPMTERFLADLLGRIIRLPVTLTAMALQVVTLNLEAVAATGRDLLPTAIDSLAPASPALHALRDMPIGSGVDIHSIIADRGREGVVTGTDGVVPYWSSHLPDVRSERIISADHSLIDEPAAMEEVKRILRLHLERPGG